MSTRLSMMEMMLYDEALSGASPSKPTSLTAIQAVSTLGTNLVGAWLFTEGSGTNVADATGTLGTATLTAPTWSTVLPGPGTVVTFNGTTSKLQFPSFSPSIVTAVTTEATILYILKATGSNNGLDNIGNGDNCHYPYSDGTLYIDTFRNSRANAVVNAFDKTAWHHFAVRTKFEANGYRLLQNGVMFDQRLGEAVIRNAFDPPKFGVAVDGVTFFTGSLATILLWNRGLTDAELLDAYNAWH